MNVVTCTWCATELPAGALFCGECGRAVVPDANRVPRVQVPTVIPVTRQDRLKQPSIHDVQPAGAAEPGWSDQGQPDRGQPAAWHWGESSGPRCESCGAVLGVDDIFCGECGAVSRAIASAFGRQRDTVAIEPVSLQQAPFLPAPVDPALIEPAPIEQAPFDPAPTNSARIEQAPFEPAPTNSARIEPAWIESAPISSAPIEPAAFELTPPPITRTPETERDVIRPSRPAQRPFADLADLEATRIVALGRRGERFVLQFSTGESSTVFGSGLVGRNPLPEPGEYFDQLVPVIDPSRSVSKTHLEFGQESGSFWVMDRYSGNGTIVREPEAPAVRCQPERRYRVARGTRVEIGEQFFIVS